MADVHKVVFYPVGNGDTTQIVLSGGRRVLFDFCHRERAEDTDTPEIDLKSRLKDELKTVDRDYFDVVAFTHADLDHIQGSTDFFELQHAKKYQGEGRIKIRELWVPAAMLLEEADKDHQQEEFVLLRQEARHRLLEGKDILVFSKPKALADWLEPRLNERGEAASARDHLFIDAGTIVPGFSLASDGVEFFCHSPFIKHCDEGDIIRNRASLVFNVRFLADGAYYDYLEVAMPPEEWKTSSARRGTTRTMSASPGICVQHPAPLRLSVLNEEGRKATKRLSRSRWSRNCCSRKRRLHRQLQQAHSRHQESYEQVQPLHIQARNTYERYLKEVGGRKFLVTMEEPNANKPEPIVFEIASGGVTWKRSASIGAGHHHQPAARRLTSWMMPDAYTSSRTS